MFNCIREKYDCPLWLNFLKPNHFKYPSTLAVTLGADYRVRPVYINESGFPGGRGGVAPTATVYIKTSFCGKS